MLWKREEQVANRLLLKNAFPRQRVGTRKREEQVANRLLLKNEKMPLS
jgi:hypothetical protein